MRDETKRKDSSERRLAAWAAALWLAVAANTAIAAEHTAHVHGVTKLNVAIEGETVEMELIAPGADIVGFEHAPESPQDKAAVTAAVAALRDGAGLFVFPREASCRLLEADVESGLLADDHAGEEKHGNEQEHGEEKEAHGEEDEAHGEEHEAHGEEVHAEFHAQYRFSCARPDRLNHMDVRFFERFPSGGEIEVQTISPRGQSAQELTATSMRLKF